MTGTAIIESFQEAKKSEYANFVEQLGTEARFSEDRWVCDRLRRSPAETNADLTLAFNKIPVQHRDMAKYFSVIRFIQGKSLATIETYIADMTGHHGSAMIFNAYAHLNLLPETVIEKQEYVLKEENRRDNRYVLFGGRILNMEEQLEKRLLRNIRAHRVRGGICSDITGCKSDMWNCLECGFFVPDAEQIGYYEEQAALWREKYTRFADFAVIKGNAERNTELYERILKKMKEGENSI